MTQTAPAVREFTEKDELGRIICTQYKDFWAYVATKKYAGKEWTKQEVLKLSPERREEFFMKWKHGMNDMNTNWEFEYSTRTFLKNFHDMPLDQIDPYFRYSIKVKREFEEYCEKIKGEIGLWSRKPEVPPEVQKLIDSVGGSVVSELVDQRS